MLLLVSVLVSCSPSQHNVPLLNGNDAPNGEQRDGDVSPAVVDAGIDDAEGHHPDTSSDFSWLTDDAEAELENPQKQYVSKQCGHGDTDKGSDKKRLGEEVRDLSSIERARDGYLMRGANSNTAQASPYHAGNRLPIADLPIGQVRKQRHSTEIEDSQQNSLPFCFCLPCYNTNKKK